MARGLKSIIKRMVKRGSTESVAERNAPLKPKSSRGAGDKRSGKPGKKAA